MNKRLWSDRRLWAIIAAYVLLATAWNFAVPAYEAPDEPAHVQFVQYLANHGALPDLRTQIIEAGIESPQPPLYYYLGAVVLLIAGKPQMDVHPNPSSAFLIPATGTNAFRFLPAEGGASAIHLIRMVSVVLGMVTVVMTYALAYMMTERRDVALVAASLTGFLPQFTFLAGSVNNDNLAAAFGALAMFLIVRASRLGSVRDRDWFIIGLVVGGALLAKSSLLVLVPVVYLAILARGKGRARSSLVVASGLVISSGWYFTRNLILYGDAISLGAWDTYVADLIPFRAAGWEYFVNPFPQLFLRSYFGLFGWMNIFLPTPLYVVLTAAVLCLIGGLWLMAWKRLYQPVTSWLLLFLFIVLTLVSILVWNETYIAPQGRLVFGALAAISTALAVGLTIYPEWLRRVISIGVPLLWLGTNIYSIGLVLVMYSTR